MPATITESEAAQLQQTIEMFEVITQSQPQDYQSLEILKEAYYKLGRQKDVVNTSKRIAEAYVQLGQLSSAIMEYETILQRFPDDPDVQKALSDIENRVNTKPTETVIDLPTSRKDNKTGTTSGGKTTAAEAEDGKAAMQKIFVDGKMISLGDFNLYWRTPDPDPSQVVEPFLQVMADKNIMPIEKSVKLISEKSRLAYIPIEKYDLDIELARSFPRATCQRWCVLPIDRMSKTVLVATTNPYNAQAAAELQAATQYRLLFYIASPAELVKTIKKVFR
jgi:tetratricopeptide (TPR) repeat protein